MRTDIPAENIRQSGLAAENALRPKPERQIWRFWVISLICLGGVIWLFHTAILPFAAAFILAYFLHPVVDRLERRRIPRGFCAMIVLFGFIVLFGGVLTLLEPLVQTQITLLIQSIPHKIEVIRNDWIPTIQRYATRVAPGDASQIKGSLDSMAANALGLLGGAASSLLSSGLALFDIVTLMIVTPIVSFYLLRDWNLLIARADDLLPRAWAPTIREEAGKIDLTLAGYVRGQVIVSACLTAYYATALALSGLQFGLSIGFITGVLSFVPFVGTTTGFICSVLLALGQQDNSSQHLIAAIVIFVVGQVVENNVLTPRFIGERTGLHPVWVIFALMAGGSVFGLLGVMIAIPLAATLGVLVRFAIRQYRASRYYAPNLRDAGIAPAQEVMRDLA